MIEAAKLLKAVFEGELKPNERVAALALLSLHLCVMLHQQELRHGGHDGAGEEVRREHGENHRFGQRHKEIFRDPAQEEHGHEDDTNRERGNEGWNGNLRGSIQDGLLDLLALFEVAVDVLDLHRRIVHQDADGQRKTAQRHDVDGLAQRTQRDQRHQNRQRNRHGNDECRAPAAQED